MSTGTHETKARTADVKAEAARLGFDACGIAAADPPDPEDRLGAWLAAGYHADMRWMATTRTVRQDVSKCLPGARAVVVVAANYYAPRPEAPEGTGRVARYAWGRDYHRVLGKRLKALASHIRTIDPGAETYCCVDTGPVLERTWAAQAGIGWIGKNGLIMRQDTGSWLLLGVVVTTLDLISDSPTPDRCGDCTRCIDACPTGAIVAPREVDARRCISYHTIENRTAAPADLSPAFGDWVFGCDACQEVCPWNRVPRLTSEADFLPREGQANPDLSELAAMSEDDFGKRFSGTPIMRAKCKGIKRNASVALENMR